MTKQEFWKLAAERRLFLDGATGSNLMKAGMPAGVCPEKWILEHRDIALALKKKYVEAGSDILYTPTFTANRVKLSEYSLEDQMEDMIHRLVAISREAAAGARDSGRKVLLAGDLTMTGERLQPIGNMDFEELVDIYKEQIRCLDAAGVDLLIVETMMSLQEARAALIAAKEVCGLPVMVTMTFEKDGRTLYGTDPVTAAVTLEALGAAAVGANCSTGPSEMLEIIRAMAETVRIPVIAKPNAGMPDVDQDGQTFYNVSAPEFAEEMKLLAEAGATILGGCCGTSPEYIRLLREAVESCPFHTDLPANPENGRESGMRYLTSERRTVAFSLNQGFIIVGERINPTGKKKLQAELRQGSLDLALRYAEEQEEGGAQILDVNMGMNGIDEKEMMLRAIQEIGVTTDLPLSLDSSHVDVLEAALRRYPGRALINSVSLEKEKFQRLLPLAAKYGAMFILLPLSDRGLPESLDEKKNIIRTIVDRAKELGMTKEDIVVDGLVTTVGAKRRAALDALETIRWCREQGLATICGLSNISFGMPERSFVNTAFLTLAIGAGLTMAIANPSQELLTGGALAADLLMAKEEADLRYIEFADKLKERRESEKEQRASLAAAAVPAAGAAFPTPDSPCAAGAIPPAPAYPGAAAAHLPSSPALAAPPSSIHAELTNAVLKGSRKNIAAITKRALEQGEEASVLLNQILLPAINQVGEYFDTGRYFLPQLIASAETMKLAIEILEPLLLKDTTRKDLPAIVIATVEGDIHDIGKNLVALMLKNHGFQIIDLGKDVPKERIIAAAREHNASIIALSALMTTTMQRMREIIVYAKEQQIKSKIIIGGAVITQDFADEIGADGYSRDAAEAVKTVKNLLNLD